MALLFILFAFGNLWLRNSSFGRNSSFVTKGYSSPNLDFQGQRAYDHVLTQVAFGPRPTGSPASQATAEFILAHLNQAGWQTEGQAFIFKGVAGRNLIAKRGQGPLLILGSHYDTRPAADHDPHPTRRAEWLIGANDGASGVAVLLELARVLDSAALDNEVWLLFFDAEDQGGLAGWPFSVGSRFMAASLTRSPEAVVIVDMVGDSDQQFFYERFSSQDLQAELWAVAAQLGYAAHFQPHHRHTIIDDHLPFRERGIPAIDIIDFDYPYWHTMADTADKVSPDSLERVGRTLEAWVEGK